MPNLTLETQEKQKPIIFIYGDNLLITHLLDQYSKDFKIAYIGDLEFDVKEDFYRIPKTNAKFVKDLEEKMDYAVIFLSDVDKKNLPQIFDKIEHDHTKTTVLADIHEVEKFYDIILEYKKLTSLNFLFLGDIYAEQGDYSDSKIAGEIQNARSKAVVTVTESDLTPIFPIYLKDAVSGINQILFGPKTNTRFFYLFYSQPQTFISAAHILKRVVHDLEIKYQDKAEKDEKSFEEIERPLVAKIATTPLFLDKYFIGFEKSLAFFEEKPLVENKKQETRDKVIEFSKSVPRKPLTKTLIFAAITSVILFVLLNAAMIGLGFFQIRTSAQALKQGEFKRASSNIKGAQSLLGLSEPVAKFGAKISGTDFDQVQESVALMNIISNNFDTLENLKSGPDRETLEKTISDSIYFYFRFQQLKTEFENPTLNALETTELSNVISLAQVMPVILGYNEEKNYLLLFQNNGELRPTGGFIGSVGELKIRGGKIESFNIEDVYEYDGKLKAHIEPHYIIRRYLQPHLYLRDSNFDPDFQKSASMSTLLYNLETGKKVDGVLAINFESVRRLIEEIGPVELPAYKKVLDGKNTFDFLQNIIDDNFFPGSSEKRDVLTGLFNQLILKLEKQDKLIKALSLLPKLAEEKHLLFAFNNSSIQSIFNNLGHGGTLRDNRSAEESSINDFLLINEANIGVNKANINISRSTDYYVAFENGIKSRILHSLNNTGDKEYKAYVRIAAPLGSRLTSISFDKEKQAIVPAVTDANLYERSAFRAPLGLEVDEVIENNLKIFGFIVTVEPKKKREIELTYDSGLVIPAEAIVTYSLFLIKQPGTESYPFTLRLSYGEKFVPKEVENAALEKDSIVIKHQLEKDEIFDVKLIKR